MDIVSEGVTKLYAATRFMLYPILSGEEKFSIDELREYVESKNSYTLIYASPFSLRVVKAVLGRKEHNEIPSKPESMPPLKRLHKEGLISIQGLSVRVTDPKYYRSLILGSKIGARIVSTFEAIRREKVVSIQELSLKSGRDYRMLAWEILVLRLLYPNILEIVIRNTELNYVLVSKKRYRSIGEVYRELERFKADEIFVMVNPMLVNHQRSNKWGDIGPITKYLIPRIYENVDFQDAYVCDVGCGYGVKAAYALSKGARYCVLTDIRIREEAKELLKNSHADFVQANASNLPFRDLAFSHSIFWNVINFVEDKESTLSELKRITSNYILFSSYNALSARHKLSAQEFIKLVNKIGEIIEFLKNSKHIQSIIRCKS